MEKSYLIFANTALALARSHQEALSRNCVAPTTYWWGVITNSTTANAAIELAESGDFGPDSDERFAGSGLNDAEKSSLIAFESMDPSWFPVE